MKRVFKVTLEIGDKNQNGRIDVAGEVEVLGRRATLPPRDLPRQPVLAVISSALEALKLPGDVLRSLGLPAISVRALSGVMSQPAPVKAKAKAKADDKA